MTYKRIIGAWPGSGTVFELEDGMFAFVNHEVSTTEAKYHTLADFFLRHGYFESPKRLPAGNCDKDIKVLKQLEKPDEYYGFTRDQYDRMIRQRERLNGAANENGGGTK